MERKEMMISIPLKRYEELLEEEVRLNLVSSMIVNGGYYVNADVLTALGTDEAVILADEIRNKKRSSYEK